MAVIVKNATTGLVHCPDMELPDMHRTCIGSSLPVAINTILNAMS